MAINDGWSTFTSGFSTNYTVTNTVYWVSGSDGVHYVLNKKEAASQEALPPFDPDKEFEGAEKWHPTGSNYICDPPVENTDIDYVVWYKDVKLIPSKWHRNYISMIVDGHYKDTGGSYRWDRYNLIYVTTEEDFNKWVKATELAKKLNLLKKKDRVSLFDAVVKNKDPSNRWFDYLVEWE